MKYSIVVAMDEIHGIGRNNDLPWHFTDDLRHFRRITTGTGEGREGEPHNVMIMGKNTWNSLPYRPLPDRINIVISQSLAKKGGEWEGEGGMGRGKNTYIMKDLASAFRLCEVWKQENQIGEVFVIGGGEIYRHCVQHHFADIQRFYITRIQGNYGCDVFFPWEEKWEKTEFIRVYQKHHSYLDWETWERLSPPHTDFC